jgi:hypothetical protein
VLFFAQRFSVLFTLLFFVGFTGHFEVLLLLGSVEKSCREKVEVDCDVGGILETS